MAVLTESRTALPTGTWALDPVHSTIGFELPYLAGTFRGHFTDVDAKLTAESLEVGIVRMRKSLCQVHAASAT